MAAISARAFGTTNIVFALLDALLPRLRGAQTIPRPATPARRGTPIRASGTCVVWRRALGFLSFVCVAPLVKHKCASLRSGVAGVEKPAPRVTSPPIPKARRAYSLLAGRSRTSLPLLAHVLAAAPR